MYTQQKHTHMPPKDVFLGVHSSALYTQEPQQDAVQRLAGREHCPVKHESLKSHHTLRDDLMNKVS